MKTKVLFIAGNISNFDATPIKIYDYIKASSYVLEEPLVLGLLDIRNFFDAGKKNEVKKIFAEAGISVVYTLRLFPIPLFVALYLYIVRGYKKIYANNLTAGITGYFLKKFFNIDFVFDFHGSIPEERVLIGVWKKSSLKYRLMKSMEKKIAAASIANVAISSTALKYLNVTRNEKINMVIPCGINFDPYSISYEERTAIRNKMGIEDKFVILYSGSLSPWNDYEMMASLLQNLKTVADNFIFLILSKEDKNTIQDFMDQMGLKQTEYLHLSLSHNEIQKYTAAADLALLIRKRSIVNEISSPMKFGEYIGAGVPVLISPGIGDASGEVLANHLGQVADVHSTEYLEEFIKDIQTNRNAYFNRNRKFAADNYRLSSVLEKYQKLYNA